MLIANRIALAEDDTLAFRPTDIVGCALWLRADMGVTKDGSNLVSVWRDQSGRGSDLVQATGSKQPTLVAGAVSGKPAIRFDGTADAMTGTTTLAAGSAVTLLVACRRIGAVGYARIVSTGQFVNARELSYATDSAGTAMGVGNDAAPSTTDGDRYTATANDDWHVATVRYAPTADPALYKNGALQTYVSTSGDWSGTSLNGGAANWPIAVGAAVGGSAQYANFDVAEVIVFGRALTAAERQQLERYMGVNYGITVA